MSNGQFNYLRMVITRRDLMNLLIYAGLWNTNAKISAAKAYVEALFAQILTDAGIQEEDITGSTEAKYIAWAAAVELGVHVCTGMRAYAEDGNNQILYEMMHYKKSDLEQCEVQEALNKMNLIYTQATLVPIADLLPFNVTATNLTNYYNTIQTLTAAFPKHGVLQAGKKTSTENITKNFKLLRKGGIKLNTLVHTLKLTQGAFVQTYDNACIIIDLGKGQRAEEKKLQPGEKVILFTQKFLTGDTFTVRNHSDMAKIKVFLSDTGEIPTTGGIEIAAQMEIQLTIPTGFKMPFGHSLIVLNGATMDDAHVTVVLAHGKSHSKAGNETATKLK